METYWRGDIEIRYLRQGVGKEPVLLLHGFPDSSKVWQNQISFLEKEGYQTIVPDNRGFGESSKPDGISHYKLSELRKDVLGLLDHLQIRRCHIVGHDWGSALSWSVATENPERVITLTVLSNGHPAGFFANGGNEQRQRSWYMLLFNSPEGEAVISKDDFALWRSMSEFEHPDIVEGRIDELKKDGVLRSGLQWYKAIAPPSIFARRETAPGPKINLPVLGIWANRDVFLTKAQMTGSEKFLQPGCFSFKEVDAGHWMQLEQPNELNDAIFKHIRSNQAAL